MCLIPSPSWYETDLLGGLELALECVDFEEEGIALVLHRHVDPPRHRLITASF